MMKVSSIYMLSLGSLNLVATMFNTIKDTIYTLTLRPICNTILKCDNTDVQPSGIVKPNDPLCNSMKDTKLPQIKSCLNSIKKNKIKKKSIKIQNKKKVKNVLKNEKKVKNVWKNEKKIKNNKKMDKMAKKSKHQKRTRKKGGSNLLTRLVLWLLCWKEPLDLPTGWNARNFSNEEYVRQKPRVSAYWSWPDLNITSKPLTLTWSSRGHRAL